MDVEIADVKELESKLFEATADYDRNVIYLLDVDGLPELSQAYRERAESQRPENAGGSQLLRSNKPTTDRQPQPHPLTESFAASAAKSARRAPPQHWPRKEKYHGRRVS